METKVKKVNYTSKYARTIEKIRTFSYYLTEVNKDFNALVVNPNSEESKAYLAKADPERISFAKEVFNIAAYSVENLTLGYIKTWYPFINEANQICDVKKVAQEEEADYKARAEEAKKALMEEGKAEADVKKILATKGLQFTYNKEGILLRLVPVDVWTANKVLAKIKASKKAEIDARKAEDKLKQEIANKAKRIATKKALLLRLAEIEKIEAEEAEASKANKASKASKAA